MLPKRRRPEIKLLLWMSTPPKITKLFGVKFDLILFSKKLNQSTLFSLICNGIFFPFVAPQKINK
jgi:hypothetical protein